MTGPPPPVLDYEGSDYQREFWDEADRAYEDQVEAVALARLLPRTGRHLLEVGAGAGRNTPRYGGFGKITLLDYSRSQLEQARARLKDTGRYIFVTADIYRMPFGPAVFDAATMIRTLHHMAEPERALAEVNQVLERGAPLVLEYPNKRNLKSIGRWLLRRQAWNPFSHTPVEFARLNYDFHPRAVDRWLRAAGFHSRRRLSVSYFRTRFLKRVIPLGALVAMDTAAQLTGDLVQLSPSVFVQALASGGGSPEQGFWRCPQCRGLSLHEGPQEMRCRTCGRIWGLRDGIWDFREPVS